MAKGACRPTDLQVVHRSRIVARGAYPPVDSR
jgi:hypothetical protein